ncbi:YciI family protein [Nocardiopsis ganjiahuensis]|uniref:YciI family protein n=1 Tax=Nocardiopsis ganjiahuensis TaxID=239984 RepID=UPI00034798F9|nr:YciI family protein [Nocardiopsis ganjiahuensis]
MAVYAVVYTYAENSTAARDQHRPAHREYLDELATQGVNLVSGPFGPDDAPGALLLFRADSAKEALAYTEPDPFRTEGVVTDVSVREWIPVLGPLTEHF